MLATRQLWTQVGTSTWAYSTPRRLTKCKSTNLCLSGSYTVTPGFTCSYGYVTNTKIKFVIVVDSANTALRENDVRGVRGLIFAVS